MQFYYIYKALAHPELNGYVTPFTLKERLMHVKEAEAHIGSEITWLCDTMDNGVKHAFGDRPNSEFVINSEGRIVHMRTWSNPDSLRADLEDLVGPPENPTDPADIALSFEPPPAVAATGVVDRVEARPGLMPVQTVPLPGKTPFYVKLRAEITRAAEDTRTMYLDFHLDPIYGVHWNNLVDPVRFELDPPDGTTITPASGEGPRVETASDVDPREFLVEVGQTNPGNGHDPIGVSVSYYACNDAEGWCIPVTQQYEITLERDPDGGNVRGRSGRSPMARFRARDTDGDSRLSRDELTEQMWERAGPFDENEDGYLDEEEFERMNQGSGGRRGGSPFQRLLEFDADNDGRLSAEELPGRMKERMPSLDRNSDGFLDENEMTQMARGFGPGGGRPPASRLMARDANRDGKLSIDELPEQMWERAATFDSNEDGVLDADEIQKMTKSFRRGRRGR